MIFDVDGTLTATNEADDATYCGALAEEFGIGEVDTNWAAYPDVTDAGLVRALVARHRGSAPSADELRRFRARFVAAWARLVRDDPGSCRAVPGAAAALAELRRRGEWAVAIATGGFGDSARTKLAAAGLADAAELLLGCADDAVERRAICEIAAARAAARHGVTRFARVVCVGDGVWDLRTAEALGFAFVGRAKGERAERLRAAGASRILHDFSDSNVLLAALAEAAGEVRE